MKQVLAERVSASGRLEYQVDWVGDYEPTWELPECLEHAQDMVAAFKARDAPTSKKRPRGGRRRA